jgi:mRNA interferase RelE/StbE
VAKNTDDTPHQYHVELSPAAQRDLRKIPKDRLDRIDPEILGLESNPRPANSKQLTNYDGIHRLRVWDYRILYRIDDAKRVIEIERVVPRRDAYRK